jgi:hypothetical protein
MLMDLDVKDGKQRAHESLHLLNTLFAIGSGEKLGAKGVIVDDLGCGLDHGNSEF